MNDKKNEKKYSGRYMSIDGEDYRIIKDFDLIGPFLMSIPSDTDLWMFAASSGGLTMGRSDAEGSIFPYETADKLYDGHHHTGPFTLVRVEGQEGGKKFWEPFTTCAKDPDCRRNIYKNVAGDRVIFEEVNRRLGLVFRYRWSACDEFGHVRTASIAATDGKKYRLAILDGLRNILPCGAPLALYQQASSLVDAYKRADLDPESGMVTYSLTSRIIDRAEAAEQLRANVAWCQAPFDFDIFLSMAAVPLFRSGQRPSPEGGALTGRRGNYLVYSEFDLADGEGVKWHIAADSCRSHVQLAALRKKLLETVDMDGEIERALLESRDGLVRIVGSADGLQMTAKPDTTVHHFANVLFNNMRGGIFYSDYDIPAADLIDFVKTRSRDVAVRCRPMLDGLSDTTTRGELLCEARRTGDADMIRLAYEYLPLYFGRRHGDPSRPWNRFTIRVKDSAGSKVLYYEGNWRDIFQNWEALCRSFPGFIPGVIAKFVNASTIDGFNPYRITRDGIDWEVSDPDDPWSYIGYWGDHQIIYLLKFLEALPHYYPGALEGMLDEEIFTYADVPYRIRPYGKIVEDPHSTIDYDAALATMIEERVSSAGTDGRLRRDRSGDICRVNLVEKLFVPVLAKICNLVPGGGIWMNTQRPEWNDANNALAGYGISAVTLYYLRRHLSCLRSIVESMKDESAPLSTEVAEWLEKTRSVLEEMRHLLGEPSGFGDSERRLFVDSLGTTFEQYRDSVYSRGFSGKKDVSAAELISFIDIALEYIDYSIEACRRSDGLYHSYNILVMEKGGREARIEHLHEMIEGQVAALSSGKIGPEAAVDLLSSLFASDMYREDQHSFMLYPVRELPAFFDRNVVPDEAAKKAPLLGELIEAGDTALMERDASGVLRFNGDFTNAVDVSVALDRLAGQDRWKEAVARDREAVLDIFEQVFEHRTFTGRSGRMYGYEGIGCIYWHMISKLLLAVQEVTLEAFREGLPAAVKDALALYYYRVRSGLSFEKSAGEYGAFPTDPYSHTPLHAGAQQPGMTGQVKEEIIARFGELGVVVREGRAGFDPVILKRDEFMGEGGSFEYYDIDGGSKTIDLDEGSLAFTCCQVPVVYHLSETGPWLEVTMADGSRTKQESAYLDTDTSRALFDRLGTISRIDAGIREDNLLG